MTADVHDTSRAGPDERGALARVRAAALFVLLTATFLATPAPPAHAAADITGVVTVAQTGTPLENIAVTAHNFDGAVVASTTSGSDGSWTLSGGPLSNDQFYTVAAIDGSGTHGLDYKGFVGPGDTGIALEMSNVTVVVSGKVTSMDGALQDAAVRPWVPEESNRDIGLRTDASGDYQTPALSVFADGGGNTILVEPPDSTEYYSENVVVNSSGGSETADVYLYTPGGIGGTITDGSGAPLQGIVVSGSGFSKVTTGSDGSYLVEPLRPTDAPFGRTYIVGFFDEADGACTTEYFDDSVDEAGAEPIRVEDGATTAVSAALACSGGGADGGGDDGSGGGDSGGDTGSGDSGGSGDTAAASDLFTDDDTSIFEDEIDALGRSGITKGCNPPANDEFCPDDFVTRGQMAAFLDRALDLPAGSGNPFSDDDTSIFEDNIEAIARAGITRGCNPPANDEFCPDDFVTREQMAAFLFRAGLTS